MEQKDGTLRMCRRCLTRDRGDQEAAYRTIKEYVDNLDSNEKTSEGIYEERLERCRECEMLLAGMCRSCGCYVEMRAALQKNECPRKKW